MLRRKILDRLKSWKNDKHKKSLLLIGARQVGKTFIVKEFAKEEYNNNYIYINFELDPKAKFFFSDSLKPEAIIRNIQYSSEYSNIHVNQDTLFIFDEIQSCPEAITALKFFCEENINVIGTGSLLGVGLKRVSSYPVGYVEQIEMFPLDFEEFLWAKGLDTSKFPNMINESEPIVSPIHDEYMNLFKEYMIIGGMPDVVNMHIEHASYEQILNTQRNIVNSYKNDIAKYSDNNTKEKAKACFESVPFQLSKENKKFIYNNIEPRARSRTHEDSLNWLIDAGIVYKCNCLTNLELPLRAYADPKIFKIYMLDSGLLVSMLDNGTADKIMSGDLKIYKGAIYENVVANILHSLDLPLLYYKKDNKWELDFILNLFGKIIPVEVKSSENTKSKSLHYLMDSYSLDLGIKVSSMNKMFAKREKYLPLYLLPFIKYLKLESI